MALHRRDLVGSFDSAVSAVSSAVSSVNSQIESAVGIPASATSKQATTTGSVKSTSSSGASEASVKATSTTKSAAATTSQSTKAASSSTDRAAASTITSSSSSSPISTTNSSPPSSTSSKISSTTSSSTLTASTIPTSAPTPTPTILPSSTDDGNHVSSAGIAVAAVFGLLILSGIIYLVWKYLPAARRHRERAYQARSHRKGLSFDDEENTDMQFDDPKAGLGLRKFSFTTSPTYYPGQTHESDLSQRRPLTSASSQGHAVSSASTRSMTSLYEHTLPSALQAGPTRYMPYAPHDVRASQIGLAMPIRSPSPEKGLPPVPLPSIGYGRHFSRRESIGSS